MTLRWWKSAALVAAVGVFGSGCIINVSQTRNTYESCGTGDVCNGASNCTSVNVNGSAASFCTQSCSSDAMCPSRLSNAGSCFMGTCFQKCSLPSDCGSGMTCSVVPQGSGTINLCVPLSGVTRTVYERSDAGDVCSTGASWISVSVNGNSGAFCTQSCSSDAACPSRLGNAGSCFMGTCFQKCSSPSDCGSGMTCSPVMQGSGVINLCVPGSGSTPQCGAIGQSCCGGTTCNDAAAACASDGICKPKVYLGCTAASAAANDQCSDAPTPSGARVQTTCVRPPFSSAGPDGYCSTVCNGNNNSCPQPNGGSAGCYTFTGMTQPMCFVDCAIAPNSCPTGTACVMLTSNTGAAVRVCAPPVSG